MSDFKFVVYGDHPVFKRIDQKCKTQQEVDEQVLELRSVGYRVTVGDISPDVFLFGANPDCEHVIIAASGGGIKCAKCSGWFCY